MKYVYTAVFSLEPDTKETYNVDFPDLPGCHTFGENLSEALEMAQDALCLMLYDMEQENRAIPAATPPSKIKVYGNDFVTAISVDTEFYRRFYETKLVKKTLNIPMWLNESAVRANINFSSVLQEALKSHLQIQE
ncbi:MAG: type II toxin-antitoxin system HicB family antitoxin [Oscillospiraceae bacterium]|nr:type II toxin-antitoxin system HicB family antitoxin [Oscillospiraceae bacterium]